MRKYSKDKMREKGETYMIYIYHLTLFDIGGGGGGGHYALQKMFLITVLKSLGGGS